MTFALFSDVRETSASTGTGDLVLAGAVTSYFPFAHRFANGDTFYYGIKQGTNREIGLGRYNAGANSISRVTVYESSNSDAAVNWGSGAKDVYVTLPGGGSHGNVVDAQQRFKGGVPWFDVTAFGAKGDGSDATVGFAAALSAASGGGAGGRVWVPAGVYVISQTLQVLDRVVIIGACREAILITAGSNDVTIFDVTGNVCQIENLTIEGKGFDTASFGATQVAVAVTGNNGMFRNLSILGGSIPLFITGSNNYFDHVGFSNGYSTATCVNGGGNWFLRCDFDHQGSGIISPTTMPYPAWAASTSVAQGVTRISGGYAIVCTTAGITGASAPTLKNYGQPIADGTADWLLQAPQSYCGLSVTGSGVNENHLDLCDFTGVGFAASIVFTAPSGGPAVMDVLNSDISYGVLVNPSSNAQAWINISHCELGGGNGIGSGFALNVQGGYAGAVHCCNNFINSPPGNIVITGGVGNFNISDNLMAGSTITVQAGASDHYVIAGNVNATVSDGGTGTHKFVENAGNVAIATAGFMGSTSGSTTVQATAVASGVITLPATTDTLVAKATTDTLTNKTIDTASNTFKIAGAAAGTVPQILALLGLPRTVVRVAGVDFNSANSDTAITVPPGPAGFSLYRVVGLIISLATHSLTTATFGLFTAASGGGTALIPTGSTAITVSATTPNTANNLQVIQITNVNIEGFNLPQLFFHVGTAEGATATASVALLIEWVS